MLGLVDTLIVFQDGPIDEWSEMAKLVFGNYTVNIFPNFKCFPISTLLEKNNSMLQIFC